VNISQNIFVLLQECGCEDGTLCVPPEAISPSDFQKLI
jgi:hypothetical protein